MVVRQHVREHALLSLLASYADELTNEFACEPAALITVGHKGREFRFSESKLPLVSSAPPTKSEP